MTLEELRESLDLKEQEVRDYRLAQLLRELKLIDSQLIAWIVVSVTGIVGAIVWTIFSMQ